MKKRAILIMMAFVVLASGLTSVQFAHAQSTTPDADHIERIRTNCVEAKTRLSQLHTADTLLRVNRGQLYEQILSKLMSPFNSRVALNNLSSSGLVSVAATYQQQLMTFRQNYQQYEQSLAQAIKLDCTAQPEEFYAQIEDARRKRAQLHTTTKQLTATIDTYKNTFVEFKAAFLKGDL